VFSLILQHDSNLHSSSLLVTLTPIKHNFMNIMLKGKSKSYEWVNVICGIETVKLLELNELTSLNKGTNQCDSALIAYNKHR